MKPAANTAPRPATARYLCVDLDTERYAVAWRSSTGRLRGDHTAPRGAQERFVMRIRDLSIRVKLFSLIGVFALGFAGFLVIEERSSQQERASTANVVLMKDLVADVL